MDRTFAPANCDCKKPEEIAGLNTAHPNPTQARARRIFERPVVNAVLRVAGMTRREKYKVVCRRAGTGGQRCVVLLPAVKLGESGRSSPGSADPPQCIPVVRLVDDLVFLIPRSASRIRSIRENRDRAASRLHFF